MRASFYSIYGLQYKDWEIDVESEYQLADADWYVSRCHYWNFTHQTFDGKKGKGEVIYNMTSTFTAAPYNETIKGVSFLELPKPFTMKVIMSRKERHQEEELQSVEKEYVIY